VKRATRYCCAFCDGIWITRRFTEAEIDDLWEEASMLNTMIDSFVDLLEEKRRYEAGRLEEDKGKSFNQMTIEIVRYRNQAILVDKANFCTATLY
jgi:hypothetical protein